MHVVIVGCGRVGSGLARIIEDQGHSVAVVDKDPRRSGACPRGSPGSRSSASASTATGWRRRASDEADAAGRRHQRRQLQHPHRPGRAETFGVERVVARIYDPRRAAIYERLGIPTIATVQWTTDRVLRRLLPDSRRDRLGRPQRQGRAGRAAGGRRAGPAARSARSTIPGVARAVAVGRMGAAQVATPDLVTQDGDVVYLAVAVGHVDEIDAPPARDGVRRSHR